MDNISHSVAGLAAGELIHRSLPEESTPELNRLRRRLLLVTCWLASNFPDLDLLLTPLLPPPLGYLLHHRGHTHTFFYAIPQALLLLGLIWFLWPSARRLLKEQKQSRRGMAIALSVGFALHILMDFFNSYGVHPFHPFDSRWYYGDLVFIVEPVFWIAFGLPVTLMIPRPWLRRTLVGFLIGVPVFFTAAGFLAWTSLFALIGIAGLVAYAQKQSGERGLGVWILSAMIGIGFVGVQSFASGQAKRAVQERLHSIDVSSVVLDSSMTSLPTQPFCWTFVSIERNESAGTYRIRRGLVALAPSVLAANECPSAFSTREDRLTEDEQFLFYSEDEGDLQTLRNLRNRNCYFEAWLRFARAPLVTPTEAFDARFSSQGSRRNFTTMDLEGLVDRVCPKWVPAWGMPRADLLE